ncbi:MULTISPECIES: hypothetical protein [unclassified Microcoleus]|uniref:hypothetical protein n=1 Tax=unclassified Microcoleus TaxID=2642155 RepID=UPI001DAA5005|nr:MULTISPECIES: hypothetical protein [unclassified Microcoleus]MCC3554502.1 hypothetical protein [Microcoleus sp. PH2017_35_SFW_U_B]TAE06809.1 MAG: hypothetical protein EAZ94_30165 [Oscillatoriales cyanobacterium]
MNRQLKRLNLVADFRFGRVLLRLGEWVREWERKRVQLQVELLLQRDCQAIVGVRVLDLVRSHLEERSHLEVRSGR